MLVEKRVTLVIIIIVCCLNLYSVSALPTSGAPTAITSNNVTIPVTGASGPTFVEYGLVSGSYNWWSNNWTPVGGSVSVVVFGAPFIGGYTYYAKACDSTGCSNQVSFTMAAITPVPTQGYDVGANTLVASHFSITLLPAALLAAYTVNIPATIFFAIIIGFLTIGIWRRTKSVRLVGILYMILGPLIMSGGVGLYIGMPLFMQSLGAVLFAAGMAGILLSFVKK